MGALASVRVSAAFAVGLLITASMFWFLSRLIQMPTDQSDLATATRIEFTRMRKDTETETKREELRKAERERVAEVPIAPRMSVSNSTSISTVPVQMVAPKIETGGVKMNLAAGGADHGVTPLVCAKPIYPPRAQERGTEGHVTLRFTITVIGTVKDVEVVDSEPKGVFDETSIKAAKSCRFNPFVQNGVPVERVGLRRTINFVLEN